MEIDTALEEFIGECVYGLTTRRRRAATIKNYRDTVRLMSRWCSVQSTESITGDTLRQFLKGGMQRGWSDQTVVSYMRHLRPFLRWCVNRGYVARDPLEGIVLPRLMQRVPEVYSAAQVRRILHAVDVQSPTRFIRMRDRAIIATLQMTGLRKGELLGLELADVDLAAKCIRVRGATSKVGRDRVVAMTETLHAVIDEYAAERRVLHTQATAFWVSERTRCRFTGAGLKKRFALLSASSGVQIGAHKFRHTFATETYGATRDIAAIQQVLGHRDITTTMIYTQVKPEHTRQALERNPFNTLF